MLGFPVYFVSPLEKVAVMNAYTHSPELHLSSWLRTALISIVRIKNIMTITYWSQAAE